MQISILIYSFLAYFLVNLFLLEIVFNVRLPIWPYTRGVITVLLVIPYFGGASFVYRQFIRSYISQSSLIRTWNLFSVDSIPKETDFIGKNEEENFVPVVANNIFEDEVDESAERHILCQVGLCCVLMFIMILKTSIRVCVYLYI